MMIQLIFDFNKESNIREWVIVDDVVMGGRSSGEISLNEDGHGVFEGEVSLENNGGFSSVRYRTGRIAVKDHSKVVVRLKGDGKEYQFRIKGDTGDEYSYVVPFSTSGKWEEIEIELKDMYPTFRGRKLDMPNFSNDHFEEIAFLIGNKKKEKFKLVIDRIELR
ncbi:CIA30 family protein [Salinimicrobium sediminilitoris]|uniref:CIA30 family protein n=1 Tax=Salinimicrobium sediminilitoris TaxID=2876715 RepID=UPI001E3B02B5|nr:CIA30 family protein [Salinimicrobium sediminilitoris]MCC8359772.1 CIA30 family protein [Salinimicrobium sediminilitoris]